MNTLPPPISCEPQLGKTSPHWRVFLIRLVLAVLSLIGLEPKSMASPEPQADSGGALSVQMSVETRQEGGKVMVDGKTNLPEGTTLMVSISGEISGDYYQASGKSEVQSGVFHCKPISLHKIPLPAGSYTVKVTTPLPLFQPPSVQAAIGKHGESLSGPLVVKDRIGGNSNLVRLETGVTITGAEATQQKELNASYKNEVTALYRELIGFKDDPQFHESGFAGAPRGKKQWLEKANALGAMKSPSFEAGLAAKSLPQLGLEYLSKKGAETDFARFTKKEILSYIGEQDIREPLPSREAVTPPPVPESLAEGNFSEDVSSWNRGILPTDHLVGQVYKTCGIEAVLNDVIEGYAVYCIGDDRGREYLVAVIREPVDEQKWNKETKGGIAEYYQTISRFKLQDGPLFCKPNVKVIGVVNIRGDTGRLRAVLAVQGIK